MKTIQFNGNILQMYDSIEQMPITRFHLYNYYLLIDSGIGGDLSSIDNHISSIRRFIATGDKINADKQILNMRQNLVFIIENTSPGDLAFIALIKTINGKTIDDLSPDNVKQIQNQLAIKGLTLGKVRGFLSVAKKKWMRNLKSISQPLLKAQKLKNTILD